MAATPLFMSAAPRPKSRPSRTTGSKGSDCHFSRGPGGTTSVWPAKQMTGPGPPRCSAQKLSTSPKRILSISKPNGSSRAISNSWQPASSGVTDFRAISCIASSSVGDTTGTYYYFVAAAGARGIRRGFSLANPAGTLRVRSREPRHLARAGRDCGNRAASRAGPQSERMSDLLSERRESRPAQAARSLKLHPEQLIDGCLCARLRVNFLDNDDAV